MFRKLFFLDDSKFHPQMLQTVHVQRFGEDDIRTTLFEVSHIFVKNIAGDTGNKGMAAEPPNPGSSRSENFVRKTSERAREKRER